MIINGNSLFLGTTLALGASATTATYNNLAPRGKVEQDKLKRVGTTSLVTGVTTTALSSYSATRQALHKKDATAFVESLNDQQLATLEAMLENKNIDLNAPELENSKQMIKKL